MKSCNVCDVPLVLGKNWTEARKKHYMNTCNICNTNKSKFWKDNNKQAAKQSSRYTKVKAAYGLSKDAYDTLYKETNGCCSICGLLDKTHKNSLHVDHDHVTGNVRGLLCSNCNTALGKFKEDISILDKAKVYLIRSKYEN